MCTTASLPCSWAASITASTLLPDGKLILCNQAGLLLETEGDRLRVLKTAPLPALNGLIAIDDHKLAALTGQGVVIIDSITVQQASN